MIEGHSFPEHISKENKMIFILMAMLFSLYTLLLPNYVDPSFISWAQYIYDNGIGRVYETGSNYLPVYHYFLWLFGKIQGSSGKMVEHMKYIRLFTLILEFGVIYFVLALVNLNQRKTHNLFYALLILLNIAYVYNTLMFGQIDGMLTTFVFISFYFAIKEKLAPALIFYVISLNCKFQAILFLPLLALVLLPEIVKNSWIKSAKAILYALLVQFLILLPFLISGQLHNVLKVITEGTVNFYPYLAPSANSFWRWFIPGNQGVNTEVVINGEAVTMLDTQLFMGITYHVWGLLLFCISSFFALYPLLKRALAYLFKKQQFIAGNQIPEILLTAALINLCFYFFNTQMHSRYSHYALLFIATYSIIRRDYFIYIFFSIIQFLSLEHDLRFLHLDIYDSLIFNAYFITACYFFTILILFYKLYKIPTPFVSIQMKFARNFSYSFKKVNTLPTIIYFSFAILFLIWVLTTYRNVVHMDIMYIISTKIKDMMEHNLHIQDFVYQPLFPAVISIIFNFINAKFFHLNTVIESVAGSLFLILLGYKYLSETLVVMPERKNRLLFSILIGFIIFGLHKWEASFTSFFSFAVFFTLAICYYNYFLLVKYIDKTIPVKRYSLLFFVFTNLLVIIEAPAYIYSYILSLIIILLIVKHFEIIEIDKKRWNYILLSSALLFFLALSITLYLSHNPSYSRYASNLSIMDFFKTFFQKPLWIIKFYLIANTGPYLGEADSYIGARTLFGFAILCAYGWAIYYVIKSKDKRLLIPVALIFYNLISYTFITMSRYVFGVLEYGSSSRYTAFNLSGVLGLVTILFFYVIEQRKTAYRNISFSVLTIVILGYVYVDVKQYNISPYRTAAFNQMNTSVLTGENLGILQADSTVSLNAIEVLKKYHLNAFYDKKNRAKSEAVSLEKIKKLMLVSGSADFEDLDKKGFYGNENGITWTNGNASMIFKNLIEVKDSLTVELNTYMPPVHKDVNPQMLLIDDSNKTYQPISSIRTGDTFTYKFYFNPPAILRKAKILSDTINAAPDVRTLSFPFISLELKK